MPIDHRGAALSGASTAARDLFETAIAIQLLSRRSGRHREPSPRGQPRLRHGAGAQGLPPRHGDEEGPRPGGAIPPRPDARAAASRTRAGPCRRPARPRPRRMARSLAPARPHPCRRSPRHPGLAGRAPLRFLPWRQPEPARAGRAGAAGLAPRDAELPRRVGMYAFGLEDCDHYRRAEPEGATGARAADAWASCGRSRDGMHGRDGRASLAPVASRRTGADGFMAGHNWWHLALFRLEHSIGGASPSTTGMWRRRGTGASTGRRLRTALAPDLMDRRLRRLAGSPRPGRRA